MAAASEGKAHMSWSARLLIAGMWAVAILSVARVALLVTRGFVWPWAS